MYRLATVHSLVDRQTLTDRQTDDSMMPIVDHIVCSTIG